MQKYPKVITTLIFLTSGAVYAESKIIRKEDTHFSKKDNGCTRDGYSHKVCVAHEDCKHGLSIIS